MICTMGAKLRDSFMGILGPGYITPAYVHERYNFLIGSTYGLRALRPQLAQCRHCLGPSV